MMVVQAHNNVTLTNAYRDKQKNQGQSFCKC
jgi:hypothetical protein